MLIQGDSLEELSSMAKASVDLVFFDPPYNVGKDYDGVVDFRDDYLEWMKNILLESNRVSKRGVVVFIGGRLVSMYLRLMPNAQLVIVHKRARGFKQANFVHQYHALMCDADPVQECLTLWNDIRLPGEGYFYREVRTSNPGQTSLELTKRVIETFTEPNDVVLDPFMGSGTTAVACILTGRYWRGVEQSNKYIEEATIRIESTVDGGYTAC